MLIDNGRHSVMNVGRFYMKGEEFEGIFFVTFLCAFIFFRYLCRYEQFRDQPYKAQ